MKREAGSILAPPSAARALTLPHRYATNIPSRRLVSGGKQCATRLSSDQRLHAPRMPQPRSGTFHAIVRAGDRDPTCAWQRQARAHPAPERPPERALVDDPHGAVHDQPRDIRRCRRTGHAHGVVRTVPRRPGHRPGAHRGRRAVWPRGAAARAPARRARRADRHPERGGRRVGPGRDAERRDERDAPVLFMSTTGRRTRCC